LSLFLNYFLFISVSFLFILSFFCAFCCILDLRCSFTFIYFILFCLQRFFLCLSFHISSCCLSCYLSCL
jgi:hypothetical protein